MATSMQNEKNSVSSEVHSSTVYLLYIASVLCLFVWCQCFVFVFVICGVGGFTTHHFSNGLCLCHREKALYSSFSRFIGYKS